MAEIEIKSKKNKHASRRLSNSAIRVDLTPMVDLGFLLITFFVFTTTMAKATVMDIKTPYENTDVRDPVCNSCALTIILDKDNALYYYTGMPEYAVLVKSDFKNIRNIIQQQKKALKAAEKNDSRFSLIIKATDASMFKNFIDITDEVTINNIKRYYIDELSVEENRKMQMLQQ